jgi:hypothetical protein
VKNLGRGILIRSREVRQVFGQHTGLEKKKTKIKDFRAAKVAEL